MATEYSGLNVFRYLTFRAICGILTALVMSFVIGPLLIRKLNDLRIGETIREDGPTSHQHKSGTPDHGWRTDTGGDGHRDPAMVRSQATVLSGSRCLHVLGLD